MFTPIVYTYVYLFIGLGKMKFLFVALALYSVQSISKPIDVIVGVNDGYPVYYYDAKSRKALGPMVESFKAICKQAGLNCIFKSLPKKRLEKELIDGNIHFGSVINSPAQVKLLKNSVTFTTFNMPASLGIYSTLPVGQISAKTEDYYGKPIICVLGWSLSVLPGVWDAEKEGKIKIYKPTTIKSAVQMLVQGRAHYLYANKPKMDVYLNKDDKVYFREFKSLNQTFALSKHSHNAGEIKEKVDQAVDALFASGKIDRRTGKLK